MADEHQEFKHQLMQLQEVIASGLFFYAVWNKLRLRDEKEVRWSLERQNQILGRWKGFFTPVGIGLHRMAMLEFAKVFDNRKGTVSLPKLLNRAERDRSLVPHAQPNDLREISDKLRQAEATRNTLKKLRDQRLAHSGASLDTLPPLMSQELDKLIEDIKSAFNQLSAAHDRSHFSWDFALDSAVRDTTGIMRLLANEIDRKEIEADEQMVEIVVGHVQRMETTLGRSLDDDEFASVVRQFSLTPERERRVREARDVRIADQAP